MKRIFASELFACLVWGGALTALVAAGEPQSPLISWLRFGLGLSFILIVPGYCLQAALFPGRSALSWVERLALALGLSIALPALLGVALEYLPWGITLWPIVIALMTVTALAAVVALYRRGRRPPEELPPLDRPSFRASAERRISSRPWWLVYILLGGAGGTAALAAIMLLIVPQPADRFTEFYMLGQGNLAVNYPLEVMAGQPATVTVGIANHEGRPAAYLILVKLEEQVISQSAIISVPDGQTTHQTVRFVIAETGRRRPVDFVLEYNGRPYRTLRLLLDVNLPPAPLPSPTPTATPSPATATPPPAFTATMVGITENTPEP